MVFGGEGKEKKGQFLISSAKSRFDMFLEKKRGRRLITRGGGRVFGAAERDVWSVGKPSLCCAALRKRMAPIVGVNCWGGLHCILQ